MIAPQLPVNEGLRQHAVEEYGLLDSLSKDSFDDITSIISFICGTPISLITLLDKDRNYFVSKKGIEFQESPREISFCGHAINSDEEITVVMDAREDDRFHDNPLVEEYQAIFYAGVPLVSPQGFKLGTLCVYDHEPRSLNVEQNQALKAMAKQVVLLFEQRKQNKKLEALANSLEQRNEELKQFANLVSHDLKSPLANIIMLSAMIKENVSNEVSDENSEYLNLISDAAYTLKNYIDGLLAYYKSDNLHRDDRMAVHLSEVKESIQSIADTYPKVEATFKGFGATIMANKTALNQVLVNLCTNAIKYNDKECTTIEVIFEDSKDFYRFIVKDNGIGIPEAEMDEIFELFKVTLDRDRFGNQGSGIGLATVKKIVLQQGGAIDITSTRGEGSTFSFTFSKT